MQKPGRTPIKLDTQTKPLHLTTNPGSRKSRVAVVVLLHEVNDLLACMESPGIALGPSMMLMTGNLDALHEVLLALTCIGGGLDQTTPFGAGIGSLVAAISFGPSFEEFRDTEVGFTIGFAAIVAEHIVFGTVDWFSCQQ